MTPRAAISRIVGQKTTVPFARTPEMTMKQVTMAAALAALLSVPAFAQSPSAARDTKAPLDRETALRECSVAAGKYRDQDSTMPIYQFRACMAQHSQAE
jgi:hypothetical protein